MTITAENPICASCGVEYVPDYEGPCQEPGCTGRVSWRATADHLAARLAEVMSEWGEDQRDREKAAKKLEHLLDTYYRDGKWPSAVVQQESVRHLVLEALWAIKPPILETTDNQRELDRIKS